MTFKNDRQTFSIFLSVSSLPLFVQLRRAAAAVGDADVLAQLIGSALVCIFVQRSNLALPPFAAPRPRFPHSCTPSPPLPTRHLPALPLPPPFITIDCFTRPNEPTTNENPIPVHMIPLPTVLSALSAYRLSILAYIAHARPPRYYLSIIAIIVRSRSAYCRISLNLCAYRLVTGYCGCYIRDATRGCCWVLCWLCCFLSLVRGGRGRGPFLSIVFFALLYTAVCVFELL